MYARPYSGAMSAVYRNPTPPPIPWLSEGIFDFWSTKLHPLWTLRRPLARVVARQSASADAITLELAPNRHFSGLQAGQHISIGVEIDGRMTRRSYSPTVLANGHLSITFKVIPGGLLTEHLAQHVTIGDVLDIGQAFGQMTVATDATQPLLLLAAGSGITPMRALVAQLDRAGMPVPVTLLYWARTREELCFAQELTAVAQRHAQFRVEFALTRQGDMPAARIDDADLSMLDELGAYRALACGPGGFVEAARARLGHHVAAFESEAFSVPALADVEEGQVEVELTQSGRRITVERGTSLLVALEQAGVAVASGCRMGICNTCVCGKSRGVTRHTLTGEYAGEPSIPLKLCVSSASTDIALEL